MRLELEHYVYQPSADDPLKAFRSDVAFYSAIDPTPTLEGMSRNFNIPVGAIARYVLSKWATAGSTGLLEIGPSTLEQLFELTRKAEAEEDPARRLDVYAKVARIISWLNAARTSQPVRVPKTPSG